MEALNVFYIVNETEAVLLSAVLAAAFATWAIFSQRDLTARQTTIDFIRQSESDRDMVAYRNTFSDVSRDAAGTGPFATQPSSEQFKAIRSVLNEYEMVAIAIQTGTFDDYTYRLWYQTGVIEAWNAAAPFILARRNQTKNQALWHEFEEMARYYRGGHSMPHRRFWWRKYF